MSIFVFINKTLDISFTIKTVIKVYLTLEKENITKIINSL